MNKSRPTGYFGLLLNTKELNSIRLTTQRLLNAGYILLPSHYEAKNKVDEEWFKFLKKQQLFPRFHIIRKGSQWFIHYDYFKNNRHITNKKKTPELLNEIKRLKKTSRK